MRRRSLAFVSVLAPVIAIVWKPESIAGQTRSSAASGWSVPRTAVGRPDLQGAWNCATIIPF
jgi:hypothetical protein